MHVASILCYLCKRPRELDVGLMLRAVQQVLAHCDATLEMIVGSMVVEGLIVESSWVQASFIVWLYVSKTY